MKTLKNSSIVQYFSKNPLIGIMLLAIFFRMVAVVFAKGFGMFDDHFLYIQTPQSWVDGYDDGNWLPWTIGNNGPQGHSLTYPGFNFTILWLLKFIGFNDPNTKMYFIRFIHATLSLITVYYGYKIAEKISNRKGAIFTGLFFAILWLFPWLSVRNLVEVVCIPFLILSIWHIINVDTKNLIYFNKTENSNSENTFTNNKINIAYLLSGFWCGVSFSVRFQVAFFILGLGIAIFIRRGFYKAVLFSLGFILITFITQGLIDLLIWKRPFAELAEYVRYNFVHGADYPNGPWYNYILLLTGLLIPPICIFIFYGFFKSWKKYLIIFLPTFIFIAFHSYFPNKQERFILPALPFIIIAGISAWVELRDNNKLKWFSKKIEHGFWIFAFTLNFIALIVVSTMYSKKSRVESMVYLSKYNNISSILIENSTENNSQFPPLYYLGQNPIVYSSIQDNIIDSTNAPWQVNKKPDFILFFTDINIENRVNNIKKIIPNIVYETNISPSYVDNILYKINPLFNKNYIVHIYRNNESVKRI